MTLLEKEPTCGGHTLTSDDPGYPVDLGFQVRPARFKSCWFSLRRWYIQVKCDHHAQDQVHALANSLGFGYVLAKCIEPEHWFILCRFTT